VLSQILQLNIRVENKKNGKGRRGEKGSGGATWIMRRFSEKILAMDN